MQIDGAVFDKVGEFNSFEVVEKLFNPSRRVEALGSVVQGVLWGSLCFCLAILAKREAVTNIQATSWNHRDLKPLVDTSKFCSSHWQMIKHHWNIVSPKRFMSRTLFCSMTSDAFHSSLRPCRSSKKPKVRFASSLHRRKPFGYGSKWKPWKTTGFGGIFLLPIGFLSFFDPHPFLNEVSMDLNGSHEAKTTQRVILGGREFESWTSFKRGNKEPMRNLLFYKPFEKVDSSGCPCSV